MGYRQNDNLRRVILMGRKPGAVLALKFLMRCKVQVALVIAPASEDGAGLLGHVARKLKIPVVSEDAEVYRLIRGKNPCVADIDVVVSYLYPKKILSPLYGLARRGCINFHPAPLPDYKGRAGYNTAILDGKTEFGVSAHFIESDEFDSGPIIRVRRFAFDPDTATAFFLEREAQNHLFTLFKQVIRMFLSGRPIKTTQNIGGLYLTSRQLEEMKVVNLESDSPEAVHRKARAFFFPPYRGAIMRIAGKEFTIVDDYILQLIHESIR